MNIVYFGALPTFRQKTTATLSGSKYGVVDAISGQGIYRVKISGQIVTARSKVGPVSDRDAVIVEMTGAGYFITSKIGMAEKVPEVIEI